MQTTLEISIFSITLKKIYMKRLRDSENRVIKNFRLYLFEGSDFIIRRHSTKF